MRSKMKVLVTGGAGFIGANAIKDLLDDGHEVISFDYTDNPFRLHELKKCPRFSKNLKIVKGDLRDKIAVAKAVKQADVILHLGGQVSHLLSQHDPYYDLEVNVVGTLNILEAIKEYNPLAYLIYSSSRSVYGKKMKRPDDDPITEEALPEPIDAYGITKLTCEHYIRLYHYHHGIKTTILRQANVFGPRQQLWTPVYQMVSWVFRRVWLNETLRFMGDGTQTRDFLYVGDLVNAYLTCMENPDVADGKTYNVGGLTYCTWNEVIKTAEEVTGNKAKVVYVKHTPIRAKLENPYSKLDYTKISSELGWKPAVSLKEGFERMKKYYESTEFLEDYL